MPRRVGARVFARRLRQRIGMKRRAFGGLVERLARRHAVVARRRSRRAAQRLDADAVCSIKNENASLPLAPEAVVHLPLGANMKLGLVVERTETLALRRSA
jgi:hypothetical protein